MSRQSYGMKQPIFVFTLCHIHFLDVTLSLILGLYRYLEKSMGFPQIVEESTL
jgi:hypothetical protein